MKTITFYFPKADVSLTEGTGNVQNISICEIHHPTVFVYFDNGDKNTYSGIPFLLTEHSTKTNKS